MLSSPYYCMHAGIIYRHGPTPQSTMSWIYSWIYKATNKMRLMPIKAYPAICSPVNGVSGFSTRVWLLCSAKNWIQVLELLCLVFANPVKNNIASSLMFNVYTCCMYRIMYRHCEEVYSWSKVTV